MQCGSTHRPTDDVYADDMVQVLQQCETLQELVWAGGCRVRGGGEVFLDAGDELPKGREIEPQCVLLGGGVVDCCVEFCERAGEK